jgi:hypothetical protein
MVIEKQKVDIFLIWLEGEALDRSTALEEETSKTSEWKFDDWVKEFIERFAPFSP